MNINIAAGQPSTVANFTSYLTGTHTASGKERTEEPEVWMGDLDTTLDVIARAEARSEENHWQSVTIGFEEHIDPKTLDVILQEFLDYAMPGEDHAARGVFVAVHREKGKGTDVHIVVPMFDPESDKTDNPFPPNHEKWLDPWRDRTNIRFGLSRPDDIKNLYEKQSPELWNKFSDSLKAKKATRERQHADVSDLVVAAIKNNDITSRDDVYDFLKRDECKNAGIEVTSERHHKYITIRVNGGAKMRLKGNIYDRSNYDDNHGFTSAAELDTDNNRGTAKELRDCEKGMARHLESRIARFEKRHDREAGFANESLERLELKSVFNVSHEQEISKTSEQTRDTESKDSSGSDKSKVDAKASARTSSNVITSAHNSAHSVTVDTNLRESALSPHAVVAHENESADAYYKRTQQIIDHDTAKRREASEQQEKIEQIARKSQAFIKRIMSDLANAFARSFSIKIETKNERRNYSSRTFKSVISATKDFERAVRAENERDARAAQSRDTSRAQDATQRVHIDHEQVRELEQNAERHIASTEQHRQHAESISVYSKVAVTARNALNSARATLTRITERVDYIERVRALPFLLDMPPTPHPDAPDQRHADFGKLGFSSIDSIENIELRSVAQAQMRAVQHKYQERFDERKKHNESLTPDEFAEQQQKSILESAMKNPHALRIKPKPKGGDGDDGTTIELDV